MFFQHIYAMLSSPLRIVMRLYGRPCILLQPVVWCCSDGAFVSWQSLSLEISQPFCARLHLYFNTASKKPAWECSHYHLSITCNNHLISRFVKMMFPCLTCLSSGRLFPESCPIFLEKCLIRTWIISYISLNGAVCASALWIYWRFFVFVFERCLKFFFWWRRICRFLFCSGRFAPGIDLRLVDFALLCHVSP